jgi:sulfur carrier protein
MQAYINGEARILDDGTSLAVLAGALGLDTRKVAMEVNLVIIPRSQYSETLLNEGDHIEIVQFIGGG